MAYWQDHGGLLELIVPEEVSKHWSDLFVNAELGDGKDITIKMGDMEISFYPTRMEVSYELDSKISQSIRMQEYRHPDVLHKLTIGGSCSENFRNVKEKGKLGSS